MHVIEELKARLSELENKKRDWNEGVKRKDALVNKLDGHKKKLLELKKPTTLRRWAILNRWWNWMILLTESTDWVENWE